MSRVSADWSQVHALDARASAADGRGPDPTWLQAEHVHPYDRGRLRQAIQHAIHTRGIFELEYRVRRGATIRRVHARALPLTTATGEITEWLAVASDVTETSA